jgi:hypothetical protein
MAFAEELREPEVCQDCHQQLVTRVHQSNAGYYLGTWCGCGPYARFSDYFGTREEAQTELELWQTEGVRPHGRTTGYWPGA